ncbi:hypothetical protein [Streptomyces sp. NPDC002547]
MTPTQVFTVAAIGGITSIAALLGFIALAVGAYAAIARIIDARDAYRAKRDVLAEARRQLDAMPTAHHPTEDPR